MKVCQVKAEGENEVSPCEIDTVGDTTRGMNPDNINVRASTPKNLWWFPIKVKILPTYSALGY